MGDLAREGLEAPAEPAPEKEWGRLTIRPPAISGLASWELQHAVVEAW